MFRAGYENIDTAVEGIFEELEPGISREVLVKPNFVTASSSEKGVITDVRIVRATVRCLKNRGHDVMVGEGGFGRNSSTKIFQKYGMDGWGVKTVNLNRDERIRMDVNGRVLKKIEIAKSAVGRGILSLPKMKVHTLAGVTLGVKNLMGLLPKPAIYMHRRIHEKLVDLLSVIKPEFTIVDGVIAGERDEMFPKPVKLGVVVAGEDVISVDAVSSYIMGFDPLKIPYIRMAHEIGIGNGDISSIEVIGENPELFRRKFSVLKLKRLFYLA